MENKIVKTRMRTKPFKVKPSQLAGLLRVDYKNGLKPLMVAADAQGDKMMSRVAASHLRQVLEDWLKANQPKVGGMTPKELKEFADTVKLVNDIGDKAYAKLSHDAEANIDPVDITAEAAAAALVLQDKLREARRVAKDFKKATQTIDVTDVE
jgi:hypothetical protein